MKRSKSILIACHCLLNANAIIPPLAEYEGLNRGVLDEYIKAGVGLVQLPCPETTYLGLLRWGMTKEQYDCAGYHRHCSRILETPLLEIKAFLQAGYRILGVMGVEGSPSCGINQTCYGYTGGEIARGCVDQQIAGLNMGPGSGVFIDVLKKLLERDCLDLEFLSPTD